MSQAPLLSDESSESELSIAYTLIPYFTLPYSPGSTKLD
jgi:hypothetical protein